MGTATHNQCTRSITRSVVTREENQNSRTTTQTNKNIFRTKQFLQTLHSTTMKVLFASAMALCLLSATLAQGPMGGMGGGGMLPLMMMRGAGMDGMMPLLMMLMSKMGGGAGGMMNNPLMMMTMMKGGDSMMKMLPFMMMQGGMGGQDAGAGGMMDPGMGAGMGVGSGLGLGGGLGPTM